MTPQQKERKLHMKKLLLSTAMAIGLGGAANAYVMKPPIINSGQPNWKVEVKESQVQKSQPAAPAQGLDREIKQECRGC
jgi:hypothetical protein